MEGQNRRKKGKNGGNEVRGLKKKVLRKGGRKKGKEIKKNAQDRGDLWKKVGRGANHRGGKQQIRKWTINKRKGPETKGGGKEHSDKRERSD